MTMDGTEGSGARIVLSPDEGEMVLMGGLGVRFMIGGDQSGGGFALVEHPIATRVLAAPMHTHKHEDEYTYVLEGEIGVHQVGEGVRVATPATWSSSPGVSPTPSGTRETARRGRLRSFPPAGFEKYFAEISPLLPPNHQGPPDEQALGTVMARYGLEMDMGSIPLLVERHGLVAGEPPAYATRSRKPGRRRPACRGRWSARCRRGERARRRGYPPRCRRRTRRRRGASRERHRPGPARTRARR